MKQFIFLLGILFSLLLTNCNKSSNQHSNSDITTENIRLVDNSYNDLKSALVDSIHILKLNENEESFFVTISKVMTYNDTIYVFDRFGRDLLISFDRNGNYITKFSQKGGGPEEYARLWDFDVDSNYVYLYDRAAQRMLFYDHVGNFVKSHSTTFRGDAFVALKNNEFLFSLAKENDNKKVCIVDSTLSVKQTLLSYQKEDNDDRITDNLFQKVNGMIYYNKVVNDSVYVFSNQGHILNCYYFNFNDNNVPDEEKYSYDKLTSSGGKDKYTYFYDCPMIIDNIIVGSVFQNGNKGTFLYDIKTNKGGIKEWLPNKMELSDIILPITATTNYLIGWMDFSAYELLSDKEMLSPEFIQHMGDGGRILIFYYLNNN